MNYWWFPGCRQFHWTTNGSVLPVIHLFVCRIRFALVCIIHMSLIYSHWSISIALFCVSHNLLIVPFTCCHHNWLFPLGSMDNPINKNWHFMYSGVRYLATIPNPSLVTSVTGHLHGSDENNWFTWAHLRTFHLGSDWQQRTIAGAHFFYFFPILHHMLSMRYWKAYVGSISLPEISRPHRLCINILYSCFPWITYAETFLRTHPLILLCMDLMKYNLNIHTRRFHYCVIYFIVQRFPALIASVVLLAGITF